MYSLALDFQPPGLLSPPRLQSVLFKSLPWRISFEEKFYGKKKKTALSLKIAGVTTPILQMDKLRSGARQPSACLELQLRSRTLRASWSCLSGNGLLWSHLVKL